MLIWAVSAMVKTSRPEVSVTPSANDSVGAAASGTHVTSWTWNSGAIRASATVSPAHAALRAPPLSRAKNASTAFSTASPPEIPSQPALIIPTSS